MIRIAVYGKGGIGKSTVTSNLAAAFAALQTAAGRLQAENACCRVGQLAVNGRDLMALGAKPGPGLRGQLEALLEAVITGQLPNERQALLAAVKIELDP